MRTSWRHLGLDDWTGVTPGDWRTLGLDSPRTRYDGSWKQIDFEVPFFGEFAAPATVTGSTATLEQSPLASFPDRPRHTTGAGLLITLTPGAGTAFFTHNRGASPALISLRFMFSPPTITSGAATLARATDDSNAEVFRVAFDPDPRRVTVSLLGGEELLGTLPPGLAWHCIEITIAAASINGLVSLRINGIETDQLIGDLSAWRVERVELGAVEKDPAAHGQAAMDEIVIAEGYAGPLFVEPTTAHADDPARWVILFNASHADSSAWAEHYRAARGIPFANLIGLAMSFDEHVDSSAYIPLREALAAYLCDHDLEETILGILLGFGVPGTVDLDGAGDIRPIASLLYDLTGASMANPLATDGAPTRPAKSNTLGLYLTARIDAPDLTGATAMIDRATSISSGAAGTGDDMTVWLNPFRAPSPSVDPVIESMAAWSESIHRMRTRLPLETTLASEPPGDVFINEMTNDGFLWGWVEATPPPGFFNIPGGARVFAYPIRPASAAITTLRSATPTDWAGLAIAAGYASLLGAVDPSGIDEIGFIRPFFDALRLGWTLAEACFVASPLLGGKQLLIGDPLMTVPLPRGGWDVFGPMSRMEDMTPDTPLLGLRENEDHAALTTTARPASGETSLYVVRHVDGFGRTEAGLRGTRIGTDTSSPNQAVPPPMSPVWPDSEGWRLRVEAGQFVLRLYWDRPIRATRVAAVDLHAEIDGGPTATLQSLTPEPRGNRIELTAPLPETSVRFRWCVRGPSASSGVTFVTPWSELWMTPAAPTTPLPLVET
ncbi:MAG: hypothetical protein K8S99_06510 [Planctomycetes bacterium]|nr:hypothetical protein [Planctomycetota bacterium]